MYRLLLRGEGKFQYQDLWSIYILKTQLEKSFLSTILQCLFGANCCLQCKVAQFYRALEFKSKLALANYTLLRARMQQGTLLYC